MNQRTVLKALIAIVFLTLVVSLQGQLNPIAQGYYDSLGRNTIVNEYTPAMHDSIIDFLQGDWLFKPYYEELVNTKSPFKASQISTPLSTVRFFADPEDLNAFGMYGLEGFHSSVVEKFDMVKNDSLFFNCSDKYGSLSLEIPSLQGDIIILGTSGKWGKLQFIKCNPLEEQINKQLVVGTYTTMLDGKAMTVKFEEHGSIEGMGKLAHYSINLDYCFDATDIIFIGDEYDYDSFAFLITEDSLFLYYTKTDENPISLLKGKLFCRLDRVR